jgi:flavin-binding protein dodecin
MDSIIVREGSDDFTALLIANAMQSLDYVEVVSIVFQDCEPILAREPRGRWHVFAKYATESVSPDEIDAAISDALNSSR